VRLLVASLVVATALACGGEPRPLRLATTTSVDHSGLLGVVLPVFTGEVGVRVDVLAVGTGRALALLARNDADIALTHDPDAERTFLDAHPGASRVSIMANDFVVVGPDEDPAAIGGAASADEAFRRLAARHAAFVSRGDGSGTHARERALWAAAGRMPDAARLVETGQGMSATLRVASERRAYTLTDRATFLQMAPTLSLGVRFEGGSDLVNTYALVLTPASSRARDAERLRAWFTSESGRAAVAAFRVAGQQAFTPASQITASENQATTDHKIRR
jgi:tungstate transport system substrate-binding protein